MQPRARHRIQICLGTACYVKGGKEIAEKIESTLQIKLEKIHRMVDLLMKKQDVLELVV